MAEFPALPLWTDAYLGDTTHLSTAEHGAYLLLLMTAWRSRDCSLPDDDRLLARYTRLGPRQWAKMRTILEPFFVIENGRWLQRRLLDEFNAVRQLRERQAAKGKASALKRKGRHATAVKSGCVSVQPDANRNSTSPTPTPLPLDIKSNGATDPEKVMFDSGVELLCGAGKPEPQARSILGKWKRDHGAGLVIEALARAKREGAIEPVSFVEGCLKTHSRAPPQPERPIC